MKKIIELKYSDCGSDVNIHYDNGDINFYITNNLIDCVDYITLHNDDLDIEKAVRSYLLYSGYEDDLIKTMDENFEEWEFKTHEDEIIYIINNHFIETLTDINEFVSSIGYKFSTVDYSPWSCVLYRDDYSHDYIHDLYHNYNYYNVIVYDVMDDNTLIEYDSLYNCYIKHDDDLHYTISGLGVSMDDVVFVDNEEVKYFDVKKVKIKETLKKELI